MTDTALSHDRLMDRVYRHQRHIYDATRKYYLLGRDATLLELAPPAGGTVLEIGCGTGRNLARLASLYDSTRLFGIDISSEMLASAGRKVAAGGLHGRVRLAHADATSFDPARVFGQHDFDRIVISYTLSMIPAWETVIARAVRLLSPDGRLHIVDFGDLGGWPAPCRHLLHAWLACHHVTPRGELFEAAARIARAEDCLVEWRNLHGGYARSVVLQRQPANSAAA